LVHGATSVAFAVEAAMVELTAQSTVWGHMDEAHGLERATLMYHLGAASILAWHERLDTTNETSTRHHHL